MALLKSTDRSWPEVRLIHGFALFMGYLLCDVKGLGVLVVTWTTVVLLGGFVSVLEKKDFWSLTVITLVQIIGVFDFIWTERRSNAEFLYRGSRDLTFATFLSLFRDELTHGGITVAFIIWVAQLLMFVIMLCPLVVLYVFGVYISAGISIWRLIQHDYSSGDGGANLKPALFVLYSLAIAQGVLFGYKSVYALGARFALVKEVASIYFPDQPDLVSDYIDVTVKGCEKDTSIPRGRNLITYAVDLLLESSSQDRYISGVRILGTLIRLAKPDLVEQRLTMRQLMIASESFSHMIHRLLEILGPRSAYSEEIRGHAARILAHVASDIRLEQFPRGVQCILSLLNDTSEEHSWVPDEEHGLPWLLPEQYEQQDLLGSLAEDSETTPVDGCNCNYKEEMLLQGLLIFWKLTDDEENCRVISNTKGLLPKLMAPLISGSTHRDHPKEWPETAEVSMELMSRLLAAPGDAGTKLQCEISSNDEIIRTLEGILRCGSCGAELKKQAIGILLDLSVDTSSFLADQGSCMIVTITLLNLFLFGMVRVHQPQLHLRQKRCQGIGRYYSSSPHWIKKRTDNTKFAAEMLLVMLSSGVSDTRSATLILQAAVDDELVGHLTRATVRVRNNTCRMRAAQILKHVCSHYNEDDGYLKELKAAMADVMPKILREILCCGSTGEEIQEVKETHKPRYSTPGVDLEEGCASRDKAQRSTSSHKRSVEPDEVIELKESLISLCLTVCHRWMNAGSDLARRFNEFATEICLEQGKPVKTITSLVEEANGLHKNDLGTVV